MLHGHDNAMVQSMLAGISFAVSKPEIAVDLQRKAVSLDPVSYLHIGNLAHYLYWNGELEHSLAVFRQASEVNPEKGLADLEVPIWIAFHQRDIGRAEALTRVLPEGPARDLAQSLLHFQLGEKEASDEALKRLEQYTDLPSLARTAYAYAFRRETDQAFQSLTRVTERFSKLNAPDDPEPRCIVTQLKKSPFLSTFRADRRWAEWVARTTKYIQLPSDEQLADTLEHYAETGTTDRLVAR
jgi:tetratricopeptide (TPR) repeat protein